MSLALDIVGWVLVIALFAVGMAGTVYPILPGTLCCICCLFRIRLLFQLSCSWRLVLDPSDNNCRGAVCS